MGGLTFAFIDPEEARGWAQNYEAALAGCNPIGHSVNTDIACVTNMMVHSDERVAIERGLEGGNFFGYSLAHYYVFGSHAPGSTNVWEEFQSRRKERGYSPEVAAALEQERLGAKVAAGGGDAGLRGAVGTPKQLRDYLRRYEEAGVDQIIFVQQVGRNRHEDIMESLELFGREVLPEFQERDERQRAEKAQRLEPLIEAALERREEEIPPMPEGYRMEALAKAVIQDEAVLERVASATATGEDLREALGDEVADTVV